MPGAEADTDLYFMTDRQQKDLAVSYVWYSPVMSFQSANSMDCFTMHNTVIQRNEKLDKALRFRRVHEIEGAPPMHFIADTLTPAPLLLFMSLALPNIATELAPDSPFYTLE